MSGSDVILRLREERPARSLGRGAPFETVGGNMEVFEPRGAWRAEEGGPGARVVTVKLDIPAGAENIRYLAAAALGRDRCGDIGRYALSVAAPGERLRLRAAAVRRFTAVAGIAVDGLQLGIEFAGVPLEAEGEFDTGKPSPPFLFAGAECRVDGEPVALKEFSVSVNNNLFGMPGGDSSGAAILAAGRQEVTGYICIAGDMRGLVDSGAHSFAVMMRDEGGRKARVGVRDAEFNWHREIESAAGGGLQVLYFEGAGAAIRAGVEIALCA